MTTTTSKIHPDEYRWMEGEQLSRFLSVLSAGGVHGGSDAGGDDADDGKGDGGNASDSGDDSGGKDEGGGGTQPNAKGDGKEGDDKSILGAAAGDDGEGEGSGPDGGANGASEGTLKIDYPEGLEVGDEERQAFEEFAKGNKLSGEQASAVLKFEAERFAKAEQQAQEVAKQVETEWVQSIKEDPEFGRAHMDRTNANIKRALKSNFVDSNFHQEMEKLGMGSHPMIVKLLARVGSQLSDDSAGLGAKPGAHAAAQAEQINRRLYPTHYNEDGSRKTGR